MPLALRADKLCGATWRFGELGAAPWADALTFLPDGRIGNYRNDHEASWRLADGRLEIFSAAGELAWRFIVTKDDGPLQLEGTFLLDDSFKGVGALHETPANPLAGKPGETLAVLVVGHGAPKILDRLAAFFAGVPVRLFAHIDAKKELAKYTADMARAESVTFIEDRVPVFWGGFSMVAAELALIRAALADPDIGNVVLVSDDTAPLAPAAEIYQALLDAPDRIASAGNGWREGWYRGFFYPDCNYGALRGDVMHEARQFTPADFAMITRLEALRVRGKRPIKTVQFCRQWWALSRSKLETLMKFIDADEHFVESFRFSLFSDETFFPTAFKLCFPDETPLPVPAYTDFATVPRHPNPWIYQSATEVFRANVPEGSLFIRKLAPDKPEIFDELLNKWAPSEPERAAEAPTAAQVASEDNIAFLTASDIRVAIAHDVEVNLDQALELIAGTGSLNFTRQPVPDDVEEARVALRQLLNQPDHVAGLVHVRDRFGDYGLAGVYVMSNAESKPRLVHFCLSDRVIGMGVEAWLYERLGRPGLPKEGEGPASLLAGHAAPAWINARTDVEITPAALELAGAS